MVTRRRVLAGAAALAAGGALGSGGRARAAGILYGCNHTAFAGMLSVIPQTASCRSYLTPGQGIPASWPGTKIPAGVGTLILSFHPDPHALGAGRLDKPLAAFMAGARRGDYLVAWHEANLLGSSFQTRYHATARDFRRMQARLKRLAGRVNPGLRVAQVLGTYGTSGSAVPWTEPGLDLYGLDGYGKPGGVTPADRFSSSVADIRSVVPGAPVGVVETNAYQRGAFGQIQWFQDCFAFAVAHGMIAWATWWGPHDGAPPFNPQGAYVPALRQIAAQA